MKKTQRKIISVSYLYMWYRLMLIYINLNFDFLGFKADFQSSHEAPRSSLRVHAWALSSNDNAKQLILIRCKHLRGASCEDWKSAFRQRLFLKLLRQWTHKMSRFLSRLQHSRPCCIGYTNSRLRLEFVYPIQHGRSCCKQYILFVCGNIT
jgi:hypothetical protein